LIYPLSGINNISGTHRLAMTLRFGSEVAVGDTEKLKAELEEERKIRKSAEKEILDLKKKIDELLSRPESVIPLREEQEKMYRKSMEYYNMMVKKGVSLTTRTGTVQQIIKKYKPYGIDIKEANKALLDISEEHYTEGLKYYSEKSLDGAIKEWESCLKLNPEHENARAALKKAKRERGK